MVCARTAFTCGAAKKGRDDGVSDLVFDEARRLTRPRRVDNHFHIRNVR